MEPFRSHTLHQLATRCKAFASKIYAVPFRRRMQPRHYLRDLVGLIRVHCETPAVQDLIYVKEKAKLVQRYRKAQCRWTFL